MAEPEHNLPAEDRPNIKPSLRALEGGGAGDGIPRGNLRPVSEDESSDNTDSRASSKTDGSAKSSSSSDLKSAEESGGDKENTLFNPEGDKQGGLRGRLQNARSRMSKFSGNKWLVGFGLGGGAGLVVLVILLIMIAGSLKLPNITQNIISYEFARATRQFSQSAQRSTDEALAVQATNDNVYTRLKARFTDKYSAIKDPITGKYQDIRTSTWGKMDTIRPGMVINNLGKNDGLTLRYATSSITGREILIGGSIAGEDFTVKPVTGIAKWVPGVRQLIQARNTAQMRAQFMPKIVETMKANNTGALIRGPVNVMIRRSMGSGFAGWALEKFVGKRGAAAQAEDTAETYKATKAAATVPDNAVTDEIKAADEAAQAAADEDMADPALVQKDNANGGDSASVENAAEKELKVSTFGKVLDFANPLYAVAVPICIVYDGSVQQSQPSIDNRSNQQQAVFDKLAAEASQQQRGSLKSDDKMDTALNSAVEAKNTSLGDVTKTIAYQRGAGHPMSTADIPSPQAGSDGSYEYSLFTAIGFPAGSIEAKVAQYIVDHSCPSLTDPKTAVALGAANIIAAIGSFGGSAGAEEAAGQGALAVVKTVVKDMVANAFRKETVQKGTKTIERGALSRAKRFVFKQGLIVGGTYGLTELAHMVVAQRAGVATNGMAQGADLVDEADSGAGIEAGRIEQQQLFAAPMAKEDVAKSDVQDSTFIAEQNASQSFTQRYFAFSNANSLVSHVGMTLYGTAHLSSVASILKLGATLLRPLSHIASILTMGGLVHAAPDPSTQHYGNVQFGWTDAEENLIDSDTSYKPLENQEILDNSGKETAIANDYANCFGYSFNKDGDSWSPTDTNSYLKLDPSNSLGNLLASGKIQRDNEGNILPDRGDCAPNNLGVNNPKYGNLVFRWRLAMQYTTTLDQMVGEQGASQ